MASKTMNDNERSGIENERTIIRHINGTSKYDLWFLKGSVCNLVSNSNL